MKRINNIFKKSAAILCLLTICGAIVNNGTTTSKAAVTSNNSRLRMSFAVLSDIHDDTTKLDNAFQDLHNIDPNYSAVIFNGDTVDQGLQPQYDDISNLLKKDKALLPKKVIKNIGNHEYYDYNHGENDDAYAKTFTDRFLTFAGKSKPYFDSWVNGYHFISLGSEKCYTPDMDNNVEAFLSDAQLNWLKQELADKYRKGKPIFVFLHQPLANSVLGSTVCTNTIKQDKQLRDILSQYPEVVFFNSHTHHYLNVPGNFVQQGFAMIDTSSVHRPVRYDANNNEVNVDGTSQGVFVQVYNDKVVLKGREFSTNTWIDGAQYVVNYSNDYLK